MTGKGEGASSSDSDDSAALSPSFFSSAVREVRERPARAREWGEEEDDDDDDDERAGAACGLAALLLPARDDVLR